MALFASALQMFMATFARSFKEAQTYASILIFLPMIPGFVTQIYPLQPAGWMMVVPALAQQLLLVDVVGGEPGRDAELRDLGRSHDAARVSLSIPHVPVAAAGEDRLRSHVGGGPGLAPRTTSCTQPLLAHRAFRR